MLEFTSTTTASKRAIIASLIKLMAADNQEDIKELIYILHIGERLGLTDEDVKEISLNVDQYYLKPPSDQGERIKILYYFLFLAKADGEIQPEEVDFLAHLGMRMGFRPEMIMQLIDILKKHLDDSVPPAELFDKVKVYLN